MKDILESAFVAFAIMFLIAFVLAGIYVWYLAFTFSAWFLIPGLIMVFIALTFMVHATD